MMHNGEVYRRSKFKLAGDVVRIFPIQVVAFRENAFQAFVLATPQESTDAFEDKTG
jgi:hypothetical protein